MTDERQGLIEKKIEEIRELISEGQDRGVFFGVTVLLFLALGVFIVADKLTSIGESLSTLVKRRYIPVENTTAEEKQDPMLELLELFKPVHVREEAVGAIQAVLDTGGRPYLEIWVKSSGPAEFKIHGSSDGTEWHKTDTLTLTQAGEVTQGYANAYKLVRVNTDAENANEIEICASR